MHTSMTLTRSEVKIIELLKFRKLHFLGLSPLPFWCRELKTDGWYW